MSKNKWLGFDRRLETQWIDYMFELILSCKSKKEIRSSLMKMLKSHMEGKVAISKTVTVMMRLIYSVPNDIIERAIKISENLSKEDKLWMYWALIILCYPFVRDIAEITGTLLKLDGSLNMRDLQERIIARWGDTSTVKRVIQMVTKTMEDFNFIKRVKSRPVTVFQGVLRLRTQNSELMDWFIEVLLRTDGERYVTREALYRHYCVFPFEISLIDMEKNERFNIKREGLYELVGLKDD